ncbi:hypothetical protein [Nocardia sp. NPDC020380]|uniref:hypothetical protein n=1 Tax=Nocardia sp. NPDC020380 TaxID=3364309 RepID=UPI0037B058A4
MRLTERKGLGAIFGVFVVAATVCTAQAGYGDVVRTVAHPVVVSDSQYRFPVEWAGNFTFDWSGSGGIDLTTPEATYVRAFAEAERLSDAVGAALSYPGYAHATAAVEWLRTPPGGVYPPGAAEGDWSLRWAGTFRARILRIQPAGDGFTAAYCLDFGNVAESEDGGKTYRWIRDIEAGDPHRGWVEWLTTRAEPGGSSSSRNRSAAYSIQERAPRFNAFSKWQVTDVWGPSPRTPEDAVTATECTNWISDPIADGARAPIAPPTPQPAYPGWPHIG